MGQVEGKVSLSEQEPWQADLGQPDGIDLHGQYYAERTGGDLFDVVRAGSRVAFLVSDIAGRRPEVDPISAKMQEAFRESATVLLGGVDVNLTEATETMILAINQALIGVTKGVRFAPAMVGCYDVQLGVLAYVNAGGQTALFCDSEGTRALPNASVPLGLFTHLPYDASIQVFEPGAMLLVVTKGVTESLGSKSLSGAEKLIEVLQGAKDEPAREICSAVLAAADGLVKRQWEWLPFRGKPEREDMTALGMRRTA